MSSEDPIVSTAKGATEGALNFGYDKISQAISSWVTKFKNKEFGFIGDPIQMPR